MKCLVLTVWEPTTYAFTAASWVSLWISAGTDEPHALMQSGEVVTVDVVSYRQCSPTWSNPDEHDVLTVHVERIVQNYYGEFTS